MKVSIERPLARNHSEVEKNKSIYNKDIDKQGSNNKTRHKAIQQYNYKTKRQFFIDSVFIETL